MSQPQEVGERIRTAREGIPSCAATDEELAQQLARQERLRPGVEDCRREADVLQVRFRPGFDRQALEEMIAVEQECCPFFTFSYREEDRCLTVGVNQADQLPALDAMAYVLRAHS